MNIVFNDNCWEGGDAGWLFDLSNLMATLSLRNQHAVVSSLNMLTWCSKNLASHEDAYRTRLAVSQLRDNVITLEVSQDGAVQVDGDPPWHLNAAGAQKIIEQSLILVLENDESDRCFASSTIPNFKKWCEKDWIRIKMGGGSTMKNHIEKTATDPLERWRTFYLFDSDRLHLAELAEGWEPPAGDGCQGYVFERACEAMPRSRWHRLNRRSIENYLPPEILNAINQDAADALFSSEVGAMRSFFNVKNGLRGDGIRPTNPKQAVRASRHQGFWNTLPDEWADALINGFGPHVAKEFVNISATHSWPADVIHEMDNFSKALRAAL